MAITSGFYNALNHDRQYEATQIGSIFDGIIEDGIYETIGQKFMVTASGNGLVVNVGTGRAWFDHTWTLNDAILPIEMDEAELVLDRIDAVVLEVDASLSGRTNAVKTVKGTPSSNPVKPTLINTEEVHQYPLAYVSIAAEQTLIEQSDIENAVGTSATPFVIGILEMMDVDALVAQWQTQFENMMRDDQQDFENWEVMVKAAYEAWFAGVQEQMEEDISEFETWEQTTKTAFDTWFQNLQDELDANQAAHLQRQIGTLPNLTTTNKSDLVSAINEVNAKASASISEILIDYDPATMLGATVTLTHTASAEGHTGETYTIVLENPDGEEEVDVANLGHWTITEDRFGTQVELEIHYFGYYHVNIGGDIFINVSYADDFAGKVIYCTNADQTKTYHKTAGAIGEIVQFCVNDEGVWTIYSSVGIQRYEVDTPSTVHDNTYNVVLNTVPDGKTVLPTDDVQILLHCANIWDKSYTTLAELFNDSASLLAVTSDNNAVDYLVRSKGFITANGAIPAMTSNTTPSGVVSASGQYGSYHPYCAFDGNNVTYWLSLNNSLSTLQYEFDKPVRIKKFVGFATLQDDWGITGTVEASNDGLNWTVLHTLSIDDDTSDGIILNNNNSFQYVKLVPTSFNQHEASTGYDFVGVKEWQFYTTTQSVGFCDNSTAMTDIGANDYCADTLLDDPDWCEAICDSTYFESVLNVKVPTMTGYTTPSGEVFCYATQGPSQEGWRVFAGGNCQFATTNPGCYVGYEFTQPVCVKKVTVNQTSGVVRANYGSIQASNDRTTWVTLASDVHPTYTVNILNNNAYYTQYQYLEVGAGGGSVHKGLGPLQFYGRAQS